jgi:hypothetical protein
VGGDAGLNVSDQVVRDRTIVHRERYPTICTWVGAKRTMYDHTGMASSVQEEHPQCRTLVFDVPSG